MRSYLAADVSIPCKPSAKHLELGRFCPVALCQITPTHPSTSGFLLMQSSRELAVKLDIWSLVRHRMSHSIEDWAWLSLSV